MSVLKRKLSSLEVVNTFFFKSRQKNEYGNLGNEQNLGMASSAVLFELWNGKCIKNLNIHFTEYRLSD